MTLNEKIEKIRGLIAQRDDIDRQLSECLGDSAPDIKPPKTPKAAKAYRACSKCGRHGKHADTCPRYAVAKRSTDLKDEIEQHHAAKQRPHPETARIEQMLIEGKSVVEVLNTIDVSSPTVYVIKNRLKREGKLPNV